MERVGSVPGVFLSLNTCQVAGSLLHFSQARGRLLVSVCPLGKGLGMGPNAEPEGAVEGEPRGQGEPEEVEEVVHFSTLETGLDCCADADVCIGCCPFGAGALVMSGASSGMFSALVELLVEPLVEAPVREGRERAREVHEGTPAPHPGFRITGLRIASLAVEGELEWAPYPYLCQVAEDTEDRALLCFDGQDSLWDVRRHGDALRVERCREMESVLRGLSAVPLRLPGGKLLVAGSRGESTDGTDTVGTTDSMAVTLVSLDNGVACERACERLGSISGPAREWTSTVLVGQRFAIGFGGYRGVPLGDLWIVDVETGASSPIEQKGEWHPDDFWVPMAAWGGRVYLVGGQFCSTAHCITLSALAPLIRRGEVRRAFCQALGLPLLTIPTGVGRVGHIVGRIERGGPFGGGPLALAVHGVQGWL